MERNEILLIAFPATLFFFCIILGLIGCTRDRGTNNQTEV